MKARIAVPLAIALTFISLQSRASEVLEKAVCTTCQVRGAAHGEEDVAAWRDYEGTRYYFCSNDCAEAFDAFPTAYIPQPLPRPAPNATVAMLDGESLELHSYRGSAVLLDFWATWCKPCRKAMPMLADLHEAWPDSTLRVLGISIDEKPMKVVPKFVEKKKLRYPIALDTNEVPAWYAYNVASIPAMFLIDGQGNIVAEWRGEVDPKDVREAVENLLRGSSD